MTTRADEMGEEGMVAMMATMQLVLAKSGSTHFSNTFVIDNVALLPPRMEEAKMKEVCGAALTAYRRHPNGTRGIVDALPHLPQEWAVLCIDLVRNAQQMSVDSNGRADGHDNGVAAATVELPNPCCKSDDDNACPLMVFFQCVIDKLPVRATF